MNQGLSGVLIHWCLVRCRSKMLNLCMIHLIGFHQGLIYKERLTKGNKQGNHLQKDQILPINFNLFKDNQFLAVVQEIRQNKQLLTRLGLLGDLESEVQLFKPKS